MACLALDVLLVAAGVAAVVRMVLNSVLRYRDSRIGHDRARFVMVVGGARRRPRWFRARACSMRPHLRARSSGGSVLRPSSREPPRWATSFCATSPLPMLKPFSRGFDRAEMMALRHNA